MVLLHPAALVIGGPQRDEDGRVVVLNGQRIHRASGQRIGKSLIGQLHVRPGKGQDIQPVVGYASAIGVEIIHAVDQRLNDLRGVGDGDIADLG